MVPKAPAKEKSRQSFKDSQRRPKSIASSIWQKPKSKISSNQAHLIANARTFAFETYSPRLRLQKQPESVASSHLQSMDTSALEARSEEHKSELQSLMRISYAVFCLKKKKTTQQTQHSSTTI